MHKESPKAIVATSAALTALTIGITLYAIMQTFYSTQPVWVEQAAYLQWPSIQFLAWREQYGFIGAIWRGLQENQRHFLQLIVLGLIAPGLLGWRHAHLLITLPAFALFLGLLGWTTYRRSQSIQYGVIGIALYCALPGLANPNWGLGTGFADHQSMLLLSGSVLCLMNAIDTSRRAWVHGFAVLLGLALLARSAVAFFAGVVCGPPLVFCFWNEYQQTKSIRQLIKTAAGILAIIAVPAMLVAWQTAYLMWYYTSPNAWNLRHSLADSIRSIAWLLIQFASLPFLLLCMVSALAHLRLKTVRIVGLSMQPAGAIAGVLMLAAVALSEISGLSPSGVSQMQVQVVVAGVATLAVSIFQAKQADTEARRVLPKIHLGDAALLWWGAGLFLFFLSNGYTSDVPKEVMYLMPPMIVGALAPVGRPAGCVHLPVERLMATGTVAFAGLSIVISAVDGFQMASQTYPQATVLKSTQLEMAHILAELPNQTTWQSYTPYDWGIPVSTLVYYVHNKFALSQGLFHNAESYWHAYYPDQSLSVIQEQLYERAIRCIGAAVVLQDWQQKPGTMEEYSFQIASYVSQHVQSDSHWRFYRSLADPYNGVRLSVFTNTRIVQPSCQVP